MLKMAPLGTASSFALWLKFAPQLSLCPDHRHVCFHHLGLEGEDRALGLLEIGTVGLSGTAE